MVAAGLFGSRDPLHNPLPALIWTAWWVCFTIAQGLFGPLWRLVNPWTGPLAALRALSGRPLGASPMLKLPQQLGFLIAIVQFYAFAWFELVDLAPSDPDRLAWAADVRRLANLAWPGYHLFRLPPLPPSGILFVLLTLSTVSFDGLSRSFVWLAAVGLNPLDFPGRSAVVASSSLGILATFAALSALFFGTIAVGCKLAGHAGIVALAGRLVYSILPISLAFQIAHYLTMVLVELQNLLLGLTDPFDLGWDLIGTADYHVTTSFLYVFDQVAMIFETQTLAIALGHMMAVVLAHALVKDIVGNRKTTFIIELPFAALMVAYTAFGLWLLSTPRI